MHDTALDLGRKFFEAYGKRAPRPTIVDIGSRDVNGSLRSVAPAESTYIGLDFAEGKGVDVIITDPYQLPIEDNTADICVCSSCFEHSEFFWLLFNEALRILKPTGVFYLNVPSNGVFHRFPVDCWRFYPDSGIALQNWGRRNKYDCVLLESFTGKQGGDSWNDFIAVFLKDKQFLKDYPARIQDSHKHYTNGVTAEKPDFSNVSQITEDQNAHRKLKMLLGAITKVLNA